MEKQSLDFIPLYMDSRPMWSLIVYSRSVSLSSVLTRHTSPPLLNACRCVFEFVSEQHCARWTLYRRFRIRGCRCSPVGSSAHGPHSTQPAERGKRGKKKIQKRAHKHKEHQINAKRMKTNPVVLRVLKLRVNSQSDGKTSTK